MVGCRQDSNIQQFLGHMCMYLVSLMLTFYDFDMMNHTRNIFFIFKKKNQKKQWRMSHPTKTMTNPEIPEKQKHFSYHVSSLPER